MLYVKAPDEKNKKNQITPAREDLTLTLDKVFIYDVILNASPFLCADIQRLQVHCWSSCSGECAFVLFVCLNSFRSFFKV